MKKKNVFYIEREKFLRSMFEFAFKNQKEEIYTIDTIVDNYYLLDDLSPSLIIFDVKTIGDDLPKILAYKDRAVLVATGDEVDKERVGSEVKQFILKPIPANNLVKRLLSFLE